MFGWGFIDPSTAKRRWCGPCDVSALDEPVCWLCGKATITNAEYFALAAARHVPSDDKTPPQHEGERG